MSSSATCGSIASSLPFGADDSCLDGRHAVRLFRLNRRDGIERRSWRTATAALRNPACGNTVRARRQARPARASTAPWTCCPLPPRRRTSSACVSSARPTATKFMPPPENAATNCPASFHVSGPTHGSNRTPAMTPPMRLPMHAMKKQYTSVLPARLRSLSLDERITRTIV